MAEPDLSEFEEYEPKKKRKPCPVATAFDKVTPEELPALRAAVSADKLAISNLAVSKWLEARDITCSLQHVSAHRRKVCACNA